MEIIKNTIIQQAIALGFQFEMSDFETKEELTDELFEFFYDRLEDLPQIEDECEVYSNGRGQSVNYQDYVSSGNIVDFSENWHKSPEHKVFHSEFIIAHEGLMKKMRLYYYVGETDYNTPEGFYFDTKSKRHVSIEE